MSTPSPRKSKRRELLGRLWELGRSSSTQTVFLHQALAQTVGLNATDTKCIDLILRGPPEGITAGTLSDLTGLTTGAITHIIDRLEKRGFVKRARDTCDRRKVFVQVLLESLKPMTPRYEAVGKAFMQVVEKYTDEQLQLICDYLTATSEVSQRELARIVAENKTT